MGAHAILAPSASKRWIACTKAPRLEELFPSSTSAHADEGTLAHAIGEEFLRNDLYLSKKQLNYFKNQHRLKEHFNQVMVDYAFEYACFVLAPAKGEHYLFVEEDVNTSKFVPEGFGHIDSALVVIKERTLYLTDLKYGKGVPVDATENEQQMIYAIGFIEKYKRIFDIEQVVIRIFQPRIHNNTSWTISVEELYNWGRTVLAPAAKLAFAGEGEFAPGEHCGFCKAKVRCKALADYNMEVAKSEFANPDLLTDKELLEAFGKKAIIEKWLKALTDYTLKEALQGYVWKGFKLVEGRSNRKIEDPAKLAKILLKEGAAEEDIYKPLELFGLEKLEESLGSEGFAKHVVPHLKKPPGKPALVPESKKGTPYNPAKADFDDGFVFEDDDEDY